MKSSNAIDYEMARRLAVEASCDPRTILKLVRGGTVRGMAGQRAAWVLRRHGVVLPTETARDQGESS